MSFKLLTIIKERTITSIPMTTDKDAQIASEALFEHWGLGVKHSVSNRTLVSSVAHYKDERNVLESEVFPSEVEAQAARDIMLKYWNISSEITPCSTSIEKEFCFDEFEDESFY